MTVNSTHVSPWSIPADFFPWSGCYLYLRVLRMQLASPFLLRTALPVYTGTKTFSKHFTFKSVCRFRHSGFHSCVNERLTCSKTLLFCYGFCCCVSGPLEQSHVFSIKDKLNFVFLLQSVFMLSCSLALLAN